MIIKKPDFWDKKKPNFISNILLPFTIITKVNNYFTDKRKKIKDKKIKTICVGNIYLGGTGKTPASILIYKLLKNLNKKISIGKKYYPSHKDEHEILKKETNLILGNSRLDIINKAIKLKQKILIFDDGLQDKTIDYDLKIACFNSNEWIGNGRLIPAGPLRGNLENIKNYDAIFLKTNFKKKNLDRIKLLKKINPKIKIFINKYQIKNLNFLKKNKKYLIFSGIGSPQNFRELLLKNKIKVAKEIIFPDHYSYKKKDVTDISNMAKKINANVLTTSKDFVKIKKFKLKNINFLNVDYKVDNKSELIKFIKEKLYA